MHNHKQPILRTLNKKCADVHAHDHRAVEGTSPTGLPRSVEAGEYPEAAVALLEVGKLQAAIKRKHDMCMAQKPVLFVFRLCK